MSVPTLPASPIDDGACLDVQRRVLADEHRAAQHVVADCSSRSSVPVTSPVTTITGLSMPGTLTGGACSVETGAMSVRQQTGADGESAKDAG